MYISHLKLINMVNNSLKPVLAAMLTSSNLYQKTFIVLSILLGDIA